MKIDKKKLCFLCYIAEKRLYLKKDEICVDGILICTDLDGTLLRNDKSISRENSEAIEYFKGEGGYFTFITGRMPYTSRRLYDMVKPNAPIGCINGGGQPFLHGDTELLDKRMKGLYTEDEKKTLRLSHENADIQKLYAEYLGEPGSEKAHHLLHTTYHQK